MREIRQSGSEGGGNGTTGPPYPYHDFAVVARSKDVGGRPSPAMTRGGRCRRGVSLFRAPGIIAARKKMCPRQPHPVMRPPGQAPGGRLRSA